MSIKIKQAKTEDSAFLAQMILQSSRAGKKDGLFDLLFGTNDNEIILHRLAELIQTQAKSHCHFSNFLIAELDGKSIGSLCSYEPRISNRESFIKALEEIGYSDDNEALEVMYVCDFKLNNRTLIFDFMEELEGFRDVGVLKALMQKSLLTARLKGYTIAQTMIEIGSLESELFYKKMGFTIIEQKECELYKEKFGRIGMSLMRIEF
ncbi:MAG TPA: acyl-CoA acyltransferase [Sulfurimonas sp.]|nr:acyl-CoA acyltransferase [Sulfurimonas sp.]HIM75160.1 acyl-CoA acyltransferase [Campylobacterales bacterium]